MNSKTKRYAIAAAAVLLAVLHQDYWLWNDATLVFGFIPSGLAYHAGFSICAAILGTRDPDLRDDLISFVSSMHGESYDWDDKEGERAKWLRRLHPVPRRAQPSRGRARRSAHARCPGRPRALVSVPR